MSLAKKTVIQSIEHVGVTGKSISHAQENFDPATGRYRVGVGSPGEVPLGEREFMSPAKRTIIVLVILTIAGLSAFRVAQVISAKKNEEPNRQAKGQAPLVEVAPVTQGLIEEKILRTGDIVPYAQVTIYSKVQGWVEKVNVREGDRVKTGQVLATLDLREAEATVAQSKASLEAAVAKLKQVMATSQEAVQSQIQQAKANLDLAQSDLRRARELHEKNFIARQQLDEAANQI